MDIQIRQLKKQDWVLWKEIRLEALRLHPEAFGSSYEEVSLWPDEEYQSMLIKNDIFCSFIDNCLAGGAGFFIYELEKFKHRGCLFGLYLRKGYRGQGIADQLVEKIITHARDKVIQLHCTVTTENTSAIELYKKYGFQIYGTEPRSLKVSGIFYDEHFMVLKFS